MPPTPPVADLALKLEDLAEGEADISQLAEGEDGDAGSTMVEKCAFMVGVERRLTRYPLGTRAH